MPLYAYDEFGEPIYASDAEERHSYTCCYCHTSVRVRKGVARIPHYYHLHLPASCRLYGKSQDHLFAQLSLAKLLPSKETVIEKTFPTLLRVADVVWEPRKIVFEIQCSNISEHEAEQRVIDYAKKGYQVVWILDDRLFNRKLIRPGEKWLRKSSCYYATLRGYSLPQFYDQFEFFSKERRIKKGAPLKIQLDKPQTIPELSWDPDAIPDQVVQKTASLYFEGDLLHKAILSQTHAALKVSMQNLRSFELRLEKEHAMSHEKAKFLTKVLERCILEPLGWLMHCLQHLNARWD
jgi:competence protein CoiA